MLYGLHREDFMLIVNNDMTENMLVGHSDLATADQNSHGDSSTQTNSGPC